VVPRWVIAAALYRELKGLHTILEEPAPHSVPRGNLWSGYAEGVPVFLARTGIGGRKARGLCEYVLGNFPCKGIISIGYAGSLKEGIRIGDVLIAEEVMLLAQSGGKAFTTDPHLRKVAHKTISSQCPGRVFSGRMLSVNSVVASAQEKRSLGALYSALAVEMESGALAELAQAFKLPFLTIRTVSDDVSTSLPDYDRIRGFRGPKKYPHLLSYLLRHPGDLRAMARMRVFAHVASRALTRSVRAFLRSLEQDPPSPN
jgi:adenosylhomocysteine nucleosidase